MGSHRTASPATGAPAAGERLTAADLVKVELFPPPAACAPYVTTFFHVRCDEAEIRDIQPTTVGIVALMARGTGQMRFLDGRTERSERFLLVTPTTAAATFEMAGPWEAVGAMLSPLGWAGLTGLSAADHANHLLDGANALPEPLAGEGQALLAAFDGLAAQDVAGRLAAAIVASVRPVPPHHAALIKTVGEWLAQSLSPRIGDLIDRVPYSGRQVQRLTERYFGLPPSRLARKYRALRAAVLLSRPSISPDEIAAVQDHFYDQSHMIREIRLFAGRTPARIADPDTPYLASFMDLRDFRETGQRMAPIPADLRA